MLYFTCLLDHFLNVGDAFNTTPRRSCVHESAWPESVAVARGEGLVRAVVDSPGPARAQHTPTNWDRLLCDSGQRARQCTGSVGRENSLARVARCRTLNLGAGLWTSVQDPEPRSRSLDLSAGP